MVFRGLTNPSPASRIQSLPTLNTMNTATIVIDAVEQSTTEAELLLAQVRQQLATLEAAICTPKAPLPVIEIEE